MPQVRFERMQARHEGRDPQTYEQFQRNDKSRRGNIPHSGRSPIRRFYLSATTARWMICTGKSTIISYEEAFAGKITPGYYKFMSFFSGMDIMYLHKMREII